MNTRRNKRNLTPESEGQIPDKRNAAINTNEQLKQSFQKQTAEIGQAPVFNIHIHVPSSFARNSTKMYLPRIQPIIHVHFDELTKTLRSASKQEGGLSEKYIQNVVTQITPKFGSVLFHYKNNSFNRHFNKNEINNFNQKQTLREKNSSIESESSRSDLTETMQKHNSQTTDQSDSNDTNEKTKGIIDGVMVSKGSPIKLKKAIVVLEDICKLKSYKSGSISDSFNIEKKNSAYNSESSPLNCLTNSETQIKVEDALSSSSAEAPDENEKPHASCTNSYVNPFSNNGCPGSINFELVGERKPLKRESLASLVEGCRFAEILEKFREKYRRSTNECLEKPYTLREGQTVMGSDKERIDGDVCFTQNTVQTQKEATWVDQSHDLDEKKQEEQEDNNDGVDLKKEASQDGTESYEIENQPSPSFCERKIGFCTETSQLNDYIDPSVEESKTGVDEMNGDCEINCQINPFHVAEIKSDDCEITTRNKLSSDIVEDLKIIDFDSSNDISDAVIKSESDLVEINDIILHDEEIQYFDSKLIKKEMVSPKQGTGEKKKSRDVSENEPSSKKIKHSPETPKKSARKARGDEDYIPLNIPGPTKFAVVPLSKFQNSKTYEAKHFKTDMLFGKRVNRFSNPDHLRMYKLKKQSAGRHCDQRGEEV